MLHLQKHSADPALGAISSLVAYPFATQAEERRQASLKAISQSAGAQSTAAACQPNDSTASAAAVPGDPPYEPQPCKAAPVVTRAASSKPEVALAGTSSNATLASAAAKVVKKGAAPTTASAAAVCGTAPAPAPGTSLPPGLIPTLLRKDLPQMEPPRFTEEQTKANWAAVSKLFRAAATGGRNGK